MTCGLPETRLAKVFLIGAVCQWKLQPQRYGRIPWGSKLKLFVCVPAEDYRSDFLGLKLGID